MSITRLEGFTRKERKHAAISRKDIADFDESPTFTMARKSLPFLYHVMTIKSVFDCSF